jgi:glycosyltransferase involved in cell wall biosynthesis
MNNSLDLSFVICTRNRSARLPAILQSFAGLKTNHAWEVVFVDNASTDATAGILKNADDLGGRLRYLRADRIGLGAARDAGWRQARGRIIAFTDDDCYLAEDFADALLAVFEKYPQAGCIGGRILLYDPADARMTINERTTPAMFQPYRFVESGMLQGANISFRRCVLEEIGGFDPEFGAGTAFPAEDIDAIAATVWAGHAAVFDPAPVIWHHHRRKDSEIKALVDGYDRGRGAYYFKYLLRPDTRAAYLRGWWKLLMRHQGIYGLGEFARELRAGFAYLRLRKANAFILAALPVAGMVYFCVFCRASVYTLRRWMLRAARKLRR